MLKYNRHIAQILCLIFVLLGVEKVNFFTQQNCVAKSSFCFVGKVNHFGLPSPSEGTGSASKSKNCKAIYSSCETVFIAQAITANPEKRISLLIANLYFYKPVIHSNPYITRVDPPPIVV